MSNRRRPDGSLPPDPDAAGSNGTGRDRSRSDRQPSNRTGPGRGSGRRRPPARRPVQRRPTPRGAALLVRLKALPPFVVPVVVFALLLLGLLGPSWLAVPALVLIAALLVWLARLSWPQVGARGKAVRALVLGFVLAAIAARIIGLLI